MATSRHLEKVLAHAEDQLALAGKQRPTEVLPTYKKFLKLEEHRLRLKHQAGGGGGANSVFALGHRVQSGSFHTLDERGLGAGQSRHANENGNARIAFFGGRPRARP